jgi:hypothetical protein
LLGDGSTDIGQTEISPLMSKGQLLVIQSKAMQDRRL